METKMSKLFIIGIGPGDSELLPPKTVEALKLSQAVVGYRKYLDQLKDILKEKEIHSFEMGEEIERCKKAVDIALKGKTVSLVSSGDAGIYGMASIAFKLALEHKLEAEIIPGIPAISFCASRLGVPIGSDFALISLSDLITPWEIIVYQLDRIASTDITAVIINPGSKKRRFHLSKAANIFLRHRSPDTPVGIVENAYSKDEKITITTLKEIEEKAFENMNATVFIGNSRTEVIGDYIITERGYFKKWRIPYIELEVTENPEAIEKKSLNFVKDHLKAFNFTEEEKEIVARVIHSVGDFSIASFIRFNNNPINIMVNKSHENIYVFTDTEMAYHGINRRLLAKCTNWKLKVIPRPKTSSLHITRSALGIRNVKEKLHESILIIGNAPTALREAINIYETGISPTAVIATPVGFVGASQVKNLLLEKSIPSIVIEGNRGGTPPAVAIFNALLKIIEGKQI